MLLGQQRYEGSYGQILPLMVFSVITSLSLPAIGYVLSS